ncbi:hypothetical protein HpDR58_16470 [Helicobacter pylori]
MITNLMLGYLPTVTPNPNTRQIPQPKRKPRDYYSHPFIIETINPKNAKKILSDLLGLNEVLFKK